MNIEMSEWAARRRLYNKTKHHAYMIAKNIAERYETYESGESNFGLTATNLRRDLDHLGADQATMAAIEAAMEAEKRKAERSDEK